MMVKCNICKFEGEKFKMTVIEDTIIKYVCPNCESHPRHREVLEHLKVRLPKENIRLLHVSPDKMIEKYIRSYSNIEYVSIDFEKRRSKQKMDLCDLKFPDNHFDIILCVHVLEHIEDDDKAIEEMFRVTKDNGLTIILVPMDGKSEKTFYDPKIQSRQDRIKVYLFFDHLRLYGFDIKDQLTNHGFIVDEKYHDEEIANTLKLHKTPTYFCYKQGGNMLKPEYTAAFDVDAQKGFTPLCPNELPVPDGQNIVDALNEQAKYAKYRVGSKDGHNKRALWIATKENPQYTPMNLPNSNMYWNLHCEMGTLGVEALDGLPTIVDYNHFIWKGIEPDMHPYGACYHDLTKKISTGMIEYLRDKVYNVIVGGLATEYCLKETAMELRVAGFNVIVNLEACRGIDEKLVKCALEEMKELGIIIINKTKELENL